jgi:threonyl-tRNA synthetase
MLQCSNVQNKKAFLYLFLNLNPNLKFFALQKLLEHWNIRFCCRDMLWHVSTLRKNKMNNQDLEILRHSTAHIMAAAVKNLFPNVKFAIGPAIEEGFYYDFDLDKSFEPQDLEKISKEMEKIISAKMPFVVKEMKTQDAVKFFKDKGEIYKVEILEGITDDKVTIYETGSFIDLCKGPHVKDSGEVKNFKLLSVAGAYWRGNEKNKMLQRIYGTAFFTKEELDNYLNILEEAKKRDHRKLGKELDLFSIQELGGPGLVYWHPKGALIRKIMEDFWKEEHLKNGYDLVNIPHMAKLDLWKTSGHWDFYNENMFSPVKIEDQEYMIKPMNCPGHILIYKSHKRSYRDLPIRWAELGTVYRFERSGVLHGLMRVRGFTQDDAHLFCTIDQLENEIINVIKFVVHILSTFGFKDYKVFLSTMPEKHVGSLDNWKKAEGALKLALETLKMDYEIDPGEGVFYGPKIDIKIKDSISRLWQCSTIQVDFALPERFDVKYTNPEGSESTVIMIHRALMGSLERFFGVMIEHYAGAFPLWLAPVQAKILTVTNKQDEYADKICDALKQQGIRVELDKSSEKLGYKIRNAQMMKIPYMIVLGAKEEETNNITVRRRDGKDLGQMKVEDFVSMLKEIIDSKAV